MMLRIILISLIVMLPLSLPPPSMAAVAAQWTASGPESDTVNALAIASGPPATLYAGTLSGVFRSTTGGGTWSAINTGLSDLSVLSLVIDPVVPATLYAGTASTVFKSVNGGDTWSHPANIGLPSDWVNALTIAKATATTPAAIYAGTYSGVFMSTDGGATWSDTSNGLTNKFVVALVVVPASPNTVYAGTPRGVFKRVNDGAWSAVNTNLPLMPPDWVNALAVDPADSANPMALFAGTGSNGVFMSTNGGTSWSSVTNNLGNTTILSLYLDTTTNPSTLYAGTQGSGVFFTTNWGKSWSPVPVSGMTSTTVKSLVTRSGALLAGTSNGTSKININVYAERNNLTVASVDPSGGVPISVSQRDINGSDNGVSQFTRTYLAGSTFTLTAPASAGGNTFSSWSGCDSVNGNLCGVTLTADRTATAHFGTEYTLTVSLNGSGAGSVNSVPPTPPGVTIACDYPPLSGICSTTQTSGTAITLDTTPGSSSLFKEWSGACKGSTPCTVTLDGAKQVAASFITMPPVRIVGPPTVYYDSLQAAFNAVTGSAVIQARAVSLTEGLTLSNPATIRLRGGFDAGYVIQTGYTTVQGKLTIGRGSLVVERLVIR